MLSHLIRLLTRLILPEAPAWVGDILADAIPEVIELVEEMRGEDYLTGPQKRSVVVTEVRNLLDDSFDGVPAWNNLGEEKRDRILDGIAELAHFVGKQSDAPARTSAPSIRNVTRTLRSELRRRR